MIWPQTFYLSPDFLEMNIETLKLGMSAGHKRKSTVTNFGAVFAEFNGYRLCT